MISWMIHTEVFVNPNFGLSWLVESDHSVSNGTWDDEFADIRVSSQGVVQDDSGLLSVQSVDLIEKDWDRFSENTDVFLWSTETKTWAGEVSADYLNPVGRAFYLVKCLNFVLNVELISQVKVIKLSLLSSFASHHFVEGWSFDFLPVFYLIMETFGSRIVATHCLVILILYK